MERDQRAHGGTTARGRVMVSGVQELSNTTSSSSSSGGVSLFSSSIFLLPTFNFIHSVRRRTPHTSRSPFSSAVAPLFCLDAFDKRKNTATPYRTDYNERRRSLSALDIVAYSVSLSASHGVKEKTSPSSSFLFICHLIFKGK